MMRKNLLFILLVAVLVVTPILPQLAMADVGIVEVSRNEISPLEPAIGSVVTVENNTRITYEGKTWNYEKDSYDYEYKAVVSQAPLYNDDGSPVDCSWYLTDSSPIYKEPVGNIGEKTVLKITGYTDAYYSIKNNVFSATVTGTHITTSYQGETLSWNPVVIVDGVEYTAVSGPMLIPTDPINSYYHNNTLEWDYGICIRRVRVIEGLIQETWTFSENPHGTVWIKDNASKSKGFEWDIAPYAYDADGNPLGINQYKQILASEFDSAVYPVVIDPTTTFYTSASDGWIYAAGAWSTIWPKTAGTVVSTGTNIQVGAIFGSYGYYIYRGYLFFDTSSIPDGADIDSANVSVYGKADHSVTDFYLTIQNGMPTYPHDSLATVDYNKAYYSGDGGNLSTVGFSLVGYNNIPMNSTGISWIDTAGTTKLCIRSSEDIAGSSPTGDEYIEMWAYEKGEGYRPYLEVTYSSSGPPTVTTQAATYITLTSARLNGYLDADGGETCNVSFNYLPWYDANWSDVMEFTINHSYVDSNLTNFPVLITGASLNTTDTDFWSTVNASGNDILFTDISGNKLYRELVSINTSAHTMECYVNVPSVSSSTDTRFYMYYNNSAASETNDVETWNSDYVAVYHMNDATTSTILDSTSNDNDGTKKAANEPIEVDGAFSGDKGQDADGADDYISHTAILTSTDDCEIEVIFALDEDGTEFSSSLPVISAGVTKIMVRTSSNAVMMRADNAGGMISDCLNIGNGNRDWHYVVGTYTQDGVNSSLDIRLDNTTGTANNYAKLAAGYYGGYIFGTGAAYGNLRVGEARISSCTHSAAWQKATYYSLMQSDDFCSVTSTFTSTANQSKNTGNSFYTNLTSLPTNTLYGFQTEATNSYGTAYGDWLFFTTESVVYNVSNLMAYPASTSIELTWTKGNFSPSTYIRYNTGTFPTTISEGSLVTSTDGNSYTHTGLTPGTTYYYSAWAETGDGNYSASYDTAFTTTLAGGGIPATPTAPPMPDTWFGSVNTSKLQGLPFYQIVTDVGGAGHIPAATWWFMLLLGAVMTSGFLIYSRSKNLFIAVLLVIVFLVVLSVMGLMPMWIVYGFSIAAMGLSWKELR